MNKSDVHELLVQFYLRLNGYFTTGLIVHSPDCGNNRTELDCVAVRHPNHSQPDRRVASSDFLALTDEQADVVICEVKGNAGHIEFNQPLKSTPENLEYVLRWTGVFPDDRVASIAEKLQPLLGDDAPKREVVAGVLDGNFRVRPLLSCPTQFEQLDGKWCLTGDEILGFADKCLNPTEERDSCSTRYPLSQWGYPFSLLVEYMKENPLSEVKDLSGLYEHLGAA